MKDCRDCGEEKPLSEFYRNKAMKDGHLNSCSLCRKACWQAYRHSEAGIIIRRRYLDSKEGKRIKAKHRKIWKDKNSLKYKAYNLVNNSIRLGKMDRGVICESCDAVENLHAHHDDYAKPLEVRWLCALCHSGWHSINGKAINGE